MKNTHSDSNMGSNDAALLVESVSMKYGDFTALSDVSLKVACGEVFGFLGPNGAGKTTTIRLIAGLMKPIEGKISVYGHSMEVSSQKAKQCIGYIPDRPFLYDKLTGDEYIAFVAGLWSLGTKKALEEVTKYLEGFKIDNVRNQLIEGYSHGMKQKLVMSAALVHEPKLLIVDEPTVGLDPASVLVMKELYREMANSGKAVFLSTHSLSVAESVCDRIAIINHGKIIALGTMDELKAQMSKNDHSLEELFLEITKEDSSVKN